MLNVLKVRLQHLSRKEKLKKFIDFIKQYSENPENTTILDVGVTTTEYLPSANYLEKFYPFRNKITALAVEYNIEFIKKYPNISLIIFGGGHFLLKMSLLTLFILTQ